MGCDIQLFCEGYIAGYSKEKCWINIDHWFRQDGWAEYMINGNQGFDFIDLIEGHRDYHLFYLMAGVRGLDAENSYPPISKAKGLPGQMDSLIKKHYEEFYELDFTQESVDFHHASFLSLKELKNCGYGTPMQINGWVNEAEYEKAMQYTKNGQRYQLGFIDIKAPLRLREGLVLREWVGYLNLNLTDMIERMEQYKAERKIESDEEIRVVFWFDN